MRMREGIWAKKSLGQNFLTSKDIVSVIRDASDVNANDLVLEIGPGMGFLTETLVLFARKVIAVEKDVELARFLKDKFDGAIKQNRLEIIERDILDFDPNILSFYKELNYKLVANIPYYITGAIIKKFLTAKYKPELMVLMIQKEVAQRIVAKDKKESVLSLSVKVFGKPKIVRSVSKKYFTPQPKVDSAVLLIENISNDFFKKIDENFFFQILKAGFSHKRKFLLRNLTGADVASREKLEKIFKKLKISNKIRAENLCLKDWSKLCFELSTKKQ